MTAISLFFIAVIAFAYGFIAGSNYEHNKIKRKRGDQ